MARSRHCFHLVLASFRKQNEKRSRTLLDQNRLLPQLDYATSITIPLPHYNTIVLYFRIMKQAFTTPHLSYYPQQLIHLNTFFTHHSVYLSSHRRPGFAKREKIVVVVVVVVGAVVTQPHPESRNTNLPDLVLRDIHALDFHHLRHQFTLRNQTFSLVLHVHLNPLCLRSSFHLIRPSGSSICICQALTTSAQQS